MSRAQELATLTTLRTSLTTFQQLLETMYVDPHIFVYSFEMMFKDLILMFCMFVIGNTIWKWSRRIIVSMF
jgi:hypothetical protein